MAEDPDLDLLSRWSEGDRQAGDQLVTKYYGPVRRFFVNSVGDDEFQDLTNETFRRLMTARGTFQGGSSVRTFLFSIARRVLYDHLRGRYRDQKNGFDPMTHSVEDFEGASPSRAVARLQQYRRLVDCLRKLPVETKSLLELYYWHDCTAEDVATIHELKPATVRTRVHAARQKIMRCLERESALGGDIGGSGDDALEQELRAVGRLLISGPRKV